MPNWRKILTSGSSASLSYLSIPGSGINHLTASYAVSSSSNISSSYSVSSQNAQDILIYVKNVTGAAIPKGKVVRISGATGDNALIELADYSSDSVSANTLGITSDIINNDDFGYVMTTGKLLGINTNGFSAGTMLYLGANGSYIDTAPLAPLHSVRLGQVLRSQTNNGSMDIRIDNGYEIGELHDVRDVSSSYGDLLMKTGSIWINSKQLSGSYGITGSLSISGSQTITGSLRVSQGITGSLNGTASYALDVSSSIYSRELHVSQGSGTDSGSGTLLKPLATITKALSIATSGNQIVIHPGTYTETVTISGSANNISIVGANSEIGGIVNISGSLNINQNVGSVRIVGVTAQSISISGSSNTYIKDSIVTTSGITKTGGGYLEMDRISCEYPNPVSITGAGSVVVVNSKLGVVTVNNAAAVVNIRGNTTIITPTCTLGTMLVDGGVVYSLTGTTGAVFSGVGSTVVLKDAMCLTPTATNARITLSTGSSYSIQNTTYDKTNSVLGTSLYNTSQFQHINADSISGSFARIASITGSLLGSSSFAVSSSRAVTSSFAISASFAPSSFPFTGSARITGSLIATGSVTVTGSLQVNGFDTVLGKMFQYTTSGNGTSTFYSIPHGLSYTPTMVMTTANTKDTLPQDLTSGYEVSYNPNMFYSYVSGSNIIVDYRITSASIAPPSGTNNLTWTFIVK